MRSRREQGLDGAADRIAAGGLMVLRPSMRRKLGNLALACVPAAWIAGCVSATVSGAPLALVAAIPALPLGLFWALGALPRSCSLTLTCQGFTIRHRLITRNRRWGDVEAFEPRTIEFINRRVDRFVGFRPRDPGEPVADLLFALGIRGITRTTTLPDAYGVEPDALAATLEACRSRFTEPGATLAPPAAGASADLARSGWLNTVVQIATYVLIAVLGAALLLAGDGLFIRGLGLFLLAMVAWIVVAIARQSRESGHLR